MWFTGYLWTKGKQTVHYENMNKGTLSMHIICFFSHGFDNEIGSLFPSFVWWRWRHYDLFYIAQYIRWQVQISLPWKTKSRIRKGHCLTTPQSLQVAVLPRETVRNHARFPSNLQNGRMRRVNLWNSRHILILFVIWY